MWKYLFKRFLLMFPTLFGVALLTFVLIRIIPGDVVELRYSGDRGAVSQQLLDQERARIGLDQPVWAVRHVDLGSRAPGFRAVDVDGRADLAGDQAALRAVAPGRRHGDDRRRAAGDPPRRARRAEAGHLDRLRRPRLLDRRARHAVVLAGHRPDPDAPH